MPAAVYAGITLTRARAPLDHPLIEVHEILYPAMGVALTNLLELPPHRTRTSAARSHQRCTRPTGLPMLSLSYDQSLPEVTVDLPNFG